MTDQVKDSYNKYKLFPNLAYNCASYLIDNNELIWKLLQHPTPDAWSKSNLTKKEKGALIYDGSPDETAYRVFLDVGIDTAMTIQATILRISPFELIPTNHIVGNISMGFEIYSHFRVNTLSNYTTRVDTIVQQLIETFNGQMIGGLGRLYFDASEYSRSKAITIGQIPYKGKVLIMCNWVV